MEKEITIKLKLLKYDELNEEAKAKAFEEHLDFLYQNPQTYEDEDEQGNITEKYDDMEKWTQEEIKEYVEDSININDYIFFEDGTLTNSTTYTGNHEKAGLTELKYAGETYIIEDKRKLGNTGIDRAIQRRQKMDMSKPVSVRQHTRKNTTGVRKHTRNKAKQRKY